MRFSTILFFLMVAIAFSKAEESDDQMEHGEGEGARRNRDKRQLPVQYQVPGQILVPVPANQLQILVPALQPQQSLVPLLDPRCYWTGTPPFCKPKCSSTFEVYRKDSRGDGKKCVIGKKSLCCPKKNY